jgi:hypothetical protein
VHIPIQDVFLTTYGPLNFAPEMSDKGIMRSHKSLYPKLVAVLVIFAFLLSIVTAHRIYLSVIQKYPTSNFQSTIETNFFKFRYDSFGIAPRNSRIISAIKKISEEETLVLTSSREHPIIEEFSYNRKSEEKDSNLTKLGDIDLRKISALDTKDAVKIFTFDLEFDRDTLLVSLVSIPNSKLKCDKFQIIGIPFINGKFFTSKSKKIWSSASCIHTYPNDPGWHDFQGRLAVSDKSIYITAGLIIASTYKGYYPNSEVGGIGEDLKNEIEKNQLFGGVVKIDKESGSASRVAQGFRGPSGITVRAGARGEEIWVMDHGPRGGDELNLVSEGKDYGWPWVSYGRKYFDVSPGQAGTIDTKFGTHLGYHEPVFYWTPSIAPSQISFLRENLDSYNSWAKGDLILSSLKAKSLFRIKLNQQQNVQSYEQVVIGARVRDLSIEGKTLYLSTDDGRIIILDQGGEPDSVGAFPEVYPVNNEIYFVVPGLREFSVFVDKAFTRISLILNG